ncbi:MAG: bifunctional folylpolyglutamate synthase/dihydrofolate synthase [Dehalococcoidia bacterium]
MDFPAAVSYIQSFSDLERGVQHSADPTMSLDSVRSLLERLGNPQAGRHTVHVTGSKGKGSTAAMVDGVLRQAGLRSALFGSPHLHSYTERIALDGLAVGEGEFAAAVAAIQSAVDAEAREAGGSVSTFGILTALFFWLVRAQVPAVDWQVVEVGLGGTFDATNVFAAPDVSVITPISLEHTAILGDTVLDIASDKAGIIKSGSVCVLARQDDSGVIDVVRRRCENVGAECVYVPDRYSVDVTERHVYGQGFVIEGEGHRRDLRSPMLGRHQAENAATAVAVADVLSRKGVTIAEGAISQGIALTRLRGRLEVMGTAPTVVADGAHNGASAEALAQALRDYFQWNRCFFVLGCTRDKDVREIDMRLAGLAEMFVCCGFANPRAADPGVMVQEVGFLGPVAVAEATVADAIRTALGHARADDIVCVTGSLYVAAEAREYVLA